MKFRKRENKHWVDSEVIIDMSGPETFIKLEPMTIIIDLDLIRVRGGKLVSLTQNILV